MEKGSSQTRAQISVPFHPSRPLAQPQQPITDTAAAPPITAATQRRWLKLLAASRRTLADGDVFEGRGRAEEAEG